MTSEYSIDNAISILKGYGDPNFNSVFSISLSSLEELGGKIEDHEKWRELASEFFGYKQQEINRMYNVSMHNKNYHPGRDLLNNYKHTNKATSILSLLDALKKYDMFDAMYFLIEQILIHYVSLSLKNGKWQQFARNLGTSEFNISCMEANERRPNSGCDVKKSVILELYNKTAKKELSFKQELIENLKKIEVETHVDIQNILM
jgi:hypothetical protein